MLSEHLECEFQCSSSRAARTELLPGCHVLNNKCLIRTSFYLVKTSCKIEQLLSHHVRHKQLPGQAGKQLWPLMLLHTAWRGLEFSQFIPVLCRSTGSASVHPAGSCLCPCPPPGVCKGEKSKEVIIDLFIDWEPVVSSDLGLEHFLLLIDLSIPWWVSPP